MPKRVVSEETRRKMSEAHKGQRPANLDELHRRGISPETRRKMRESLKGKRPKNLDALHQAAKGQARPQMSGDGNPNWKGDDVGYGGLHEWVRHTLGTPGRCEICGTTERRRYEWHNLSGQYLRQADDWQRLCVPCHRKLTYRDNGYEPWNKGRKVQTNTGRTHIKPGQHASAATEFKPGLTPWNKHLEPRLCPVCGQEFQPREASRKFCSRQCYWASMRK